MKCVESVTLMLETCLSAVGVSLPGSELEIRLSFAKTSIKECKCFRCTQLLLTAGQEQHREIKSVRRPESSERRRPHGRSGEDNIKM